MTVTHTGTFAGYALKQGRGLAIAYTALQDIQKDLQNAIETLPAGAPWEQDIRLRLMLKNVNEAVTDVKRALEH